MKWINIFNSDITAAVLQVAFLSDFFPIKRGCKPGDPIAPYNITWLNSKRFKMPFVELFSDLIKQAILLPICKNNIGYPFHTVSCSNIILLHSRLLNSSNPHTYHP